MKTVSLELSKQLKEAGYPQDGYFYHTPLGLKHSIDEEDSFYCVAPTADEILDQLPDGYHAYRDRYDDGTKWKVELPESVRGSLVASWVPGDVFERADTIADAAAYMWLYIKREGLI
jgi:hypothetical protein